MHRRLVCFTFLVLTACGLPNTAAIAPTPTTSPTIADAMKALGKLNAATQVGISYSDYGPLLVDAQASVNTAMPHMAAGPLWTEMNTSMIAFAAAYDVWKEKIATAQYDEKGFMGADDEPGKTIEERYHFPLFDRSFLHNLFECEAAMQAIWRDASIHYSHAEALFTSPPKAP